MELGPWARYRAELHRFILKRVGDPSKADDLVQDVLAKALTQQHRLQNPSRLRAWLFQITRNTIVDHYRSRKTLIAEPSEAMPEQPEELGVPAERELAACLLPLLERLPPNYRDAVRMADLEDVTQRTIAEKMGLSVSGAKSRVQRGRRMLLDVLLGCCRVELDSRGGVVGYEVRQESGTC